VPMPERPNTESRLISALINIGDASAAALYGVVPEMFQTYQSEYRWLIAYPSNYDKQPSAEALKTKYPDFPYSEAFVDVGFICDEVKDKHTHRTMVTALQGAGEALRNGDTDEAYAFFSSIQHPSNFATYKLTNALQDLSFLDTYDEKIDSIEMPWPTLQKTTGGPSAGDFWVVAARLKQGKSWTLASMIVHALLAGRRTTLFSCEMPSKQVMTRIHVMLAYELGIRDVRHTDLHGRHFDPIRYRKLVGQINEHLNGAELFVIDTSKGGISTATIAAHTKETEFAVIDHMGLLISPFGKRAVEDWRMMAAISNITKEIAQVNSVPIVAAAQINREGEVKGWKPPRTKNLAQSDALGQDADVIVTMKRRSKSVATYLIDANRSGESGVIYSTMFLPNEGRFEEIKMERAKEIAMRDAQMEEDD
jgi:replicative DNA helicase